MTKGRRRATCSKKHAEEKTEKREGNIFVFLRKTKESTRKGRWKCGKKTNRREDSVKRKKIERNSKRNKNKTRK